MAAMGFDLGTQSCYITVTEASGTQVVADEFRERSEWDKDVMDHHRTVFVFAVQCSLA